MVRCYQNHCLMLVLLIKMRGMLGIAVSKNENRTNVFLYYAESGGKNWW